jgi:hypothetical protein
MALIDRGADIGQKAILAVQLYHLACDVVTEIAGSHRGGLK